jgi:hypothetical protein
MRTAFSKEKSDAVAKEEGTFIPKHKRKAGEGNSLTHKHPKKTAHGPAAAAAGGAAGGAAADGAGQAAAPAAPAPAAAAAAVSFCALYVAFVLKDSYVCCIEFGSLVSVFLVQIITHQICLSQQIPDAEDQPPNKLLFLQNLPAEITEIMLQTLFKQFPGLTEVQRVFFLPSSTLLCLATHGHLRLCS